MIKNDIRDISYDELREYVLSEQEKSFRAKQIFEWIYKKNAFSFDQIDNISETLRSKLRSEFKFSIPKIIDELTSSDGTKKILFALEDNEQVETVLIPSKSRSTVCVSTQAGCKYGCKFCASGLLGFNRDLSCGEILSQVLYMKSICGEVPLSHIVFMGVGEPLDNYDNLMKAIYIINDKNGINIGARRITISTCGLIPQIRKLSKEKIQVELAISLHASNDALRDKLVPINKKYPLKDLMAACRDHYKNTGRQITFEYIMIKDLTCDEWSVSELKSLLKGFDCKVNLIPFNEVSEFEYKTPSRDAILTFFKKLTSSGIHSVIRTPRGTDISAACGQLRIKK